MLYFSFNKHCDGSHFYYSFNSLKLMRYGSKTCSTCRKILMFVFTEGYEWCIFIFEVNPENFRNLRKPRYDCTSETVTARRILDQLSTSTGTARKSPIRCISNSNTSSPDAPTGTECMFNGPGLEHYRAVVARVIVSHFLRTMMNGPLYIPSAVNSLSLSSSDDLFLSVLVCWLHAFYTLDAPP